MGMFDSVYAPCPKCGQELEWQSKAGPCILNGYNPSKVPVEVARDITGELEHCSGCNLAYALVPFVQPPDWVSMAVVPQSQLDVRVTDPFGDDDGMG